MANLTLAEQYTLRAWTGRVVGEILSEVYGVDTLGVVTNKTFICSSLVGGIEAAFLSKRGGLSRVITAITETPDDAEKAVEVLKEADFIMLAYGGEADGPTNKALTEAFLKAAARAELPADYFFHVRIWVPGFVKDVISSNSEIAEHLEAKSNGTFTFDLEKGLFIFHSVDVAGGEIITEPIMNVPLTHEHLDLLKRSL